MTRPLNVLVIEGRYGVATEPIRELEAAGHHVLTCHDGVANFPCRGLLSADECPLADRPDRPDVALLVRPGINPHTTAREAGAICALRAGVPVVEYGPPHLDPYAPWLAGRVGDRGVVAACEAGAAEVLATLGRDIMRLAGPTLAAAGVGPSLASCHVSAAGTDLEVRFDIPGAITPGQTQALAVRVLDAVRSAGRTYGKVDVSVRDVSAAP